MKEKNLVMIIEDEPLLLQAIQKKLELSGFLSVPCSNGTQAITYLKNNAIMPDIIWLDYYLPDMNGVEFLTALKADEIWSKIPVIIVSNSASEEKVKTVLGLGAKKYILKAQYRLEDIIAELKKVLLELS